MDFKDTLAQRGSETTAMPSTEDRHLVEYSTVEISTTEISEIEFSSSKFQITAFKINRVPKTVRTIKSKTNIKKYDFYADSTVKTGKTCTVHTSKNLNA